MKRLRKSPRVDVKNRVVCVHNKTTNMFDFVKITKKGKVSKKPKLPCIIAEDFNSAVDRANLTSKVKIKKTKFKSFPTKIKTCKTWNEYIELAWKNANNES